MANRRFLNPSTMSKPIGFAQVVEITGPGRTIYVAGQLGIDADGKGGRIPARADRTSF